MTTTVKVRQRGQITLPKPVRQSLGIVEDTILEIEVEPDQRIIHAKPLAVSPPPRNRLQAFSRQDLLRKKAKVEAELPPRFRRLLGPKGFSLHLVSLLGVGDYIPLEKENEIIEKYLHEKYG